MTSFQSQADLLTAVPGLTYSFEGAVLKAQTLPTIANNTEVATTEWVKLVLGVSPSLPVVMDGGGLLVTYTSGTVTNPYTTMPIQVTGSVIGLAVGASTVEYIWVRYLDGAVVASSVIPPNNLGYLLATVTTNATNIISIVSNSSLTGWAPINSPSFVGIVTAPHPPIAENSNVVPTTSWVRSMVQTALVGSDHPTISISNSGTSVQWTEGVVNIGGTQYPVIAGQYSFTPTSQGVYSIYAMLVGSITTVVVSATAPTTLNTLLGSVSVRDGAVGQVNMPSTTGFAPINSPIFTGDPTAPNPALTDNDNSLATTKWVNDVILSKGYAPINSPVFTGDPQVPTPALTDRDTTIPTTGWVVDMILSKIRVGFGGVVKYI